MNLRALVELKELRGATQHLNQIWLRHRNKLPHLRFAITAGLERLIQYGTYNKATTLIDFTFKQQQSLFRVIDNARQLAGNDTDQRPRWTNAGSCTGVGRCIAARNRSRTGAGSGRCSSAAIRCSAGCTNSVPAALHEPLVITALHF